MKKSVFKRTIILLMTAAMLFGLALPAAAADSAIGSTLRLEKTEGTVSVKNASGKAQSLKDGMRLYNGYTVTTSAKSAAYVSLDGTKAVKLDSSSSAQIKSSGKKLEVVLNSGNLFFDVSAPLKSDESFNIRTSTMVTGVRGTSGWVKCISRGESYVYLLAGKVDVYNIYASGSERQIITITAGQGVSGAAVENSTTSTLSLIGAEQAASDFCEAVPGFVCAELAANETLAARVQQENPALDVAALADAAEERVAAERDAEDAAAAEAEKNLAAQPAGKTDQVFTVSEADYYYVPSECTVSFAAPASGSTIANYQISVVTAGPSGATYSPGGLHTIGYGQQFEFRVQSVKDAAGTDIDYFRVYADGKPVKKNGLNNYIIDAVTSNTTIEVVRTFSVSYSSLPAGIFKTDPNTNLLYVDEGTTTPLNDVLRSSISLLNVNITCDSGDPYVFGTAVNNNLIISNSTGGSALTQVQIIANYTVATNETLNFDQQVEVVVADGATLVNNGTISTFSLSNNGIIVNNNTINMNGGTITGGGSITGNPINP